MCVDVKGERTWSAHQIALSSTKLAETTFPRRNELHSKRSTPSRAWLAHGPKWCELEIMVSSLSVRYGRRWLWAQCASKDCQDEIAFAPGVLFDPGKTARFCTMCYSDITKAAYLFCVVCSIFALVLPRTMIENEEIQEMGISALHARGADQKPEDVMARTIKFSDLLKIVSLVPILFTYNISSIPFGGG